LGGQILRRSFGGVWPARTAAVEWSGLRFTFEVFWPEQAGLVGLLQPDRRRGTPKVGVVTRWLVHDRRGHRGRPPVSLQRLRTGRTAFRSTRRSPSARLLNLLGSSCWRPWARSLLPQELQFLADCYEGGVDLPQGCTARGKDKQNGAQGTMQLCRTIAHGHLVSARAPDNCSELRTTEIDH